MVASSEPLVAPQHLGGRVVGVQDGGASSVVSGHDTMMDIILALLEKGLDLLDVRFTRANKSFLFGGDHTSVADWCVHLPVWVGGVKGRIQVFLVPGSTPFLIGRPILKALKVKMDYDTDLISVMEEPWTQSLKGQKGEYLLAIDDGVTSDTLYTDFNFDYVTDDKVEDFVESTPLDDIYLYLRESGRSAPEAIFAGLRPNESAFLNTSEDDHSDHPHDSHLVPVEQSKIPCKLWKALHHSIRSSQRRVHNMVESAFRTLERKPLFWEIYSGTGNLAEEVEKHGFECRTFDLPEWNFESAKDRQRLLDLLDYERPEIVWFAPPCTKWSPLQDFNISSDAKRHWLYAERDFHEATHLRITEKGMHKVLNYGGVGVVEHPGPSKAWKTATWRRLPGHPVIVDQCALGVGLPDDNGRWKAIRKRTKLQVTSSFLAEGLSQYVCPKDHSHLPIFGTSPGIGSRSKASATYQKEMCEILAWHLLQTHRMLKNDHQEAAYPANDGAETQEGDDESDNLSALFDDRAEPPAEGGEVPQAEAVLEGANRRKGVLQKLQAATASDASRLIARLHRNLGHPTDQEDPHGPWRIRCCTQGRGQLHMSYLCEIGSTTAGHQGGPTDQLRLQRTGAC